MMHNRTPEKLGEVTKDRWTMLHGSPFMDKLERELGSEWYDGSKISQFRLCPRRYYYRHEEHLVSDEPSFDLEFGIAVHKALELVYKGGYSEIVDYNNRKMYAYAKVFLENYQNEPEKGYKTRANGLELLTQYIAKWNNEPFEILGVEQALLMPSNEFSIQPKVDKFFVVGREDLHIKWNGEEMPLDHKTTSRFGDFFEKGFKLDIGQTGYMRMTKTNKSCINALRVTNKIGDDSFVRKITTRTEEDFVEWEEEFVDSVTKIREARAKKLWSKTPSACFAYNRTCEYYTLCTASKQQRETLKETSYKREVWQPV